MRLNEQSSFLNGNALRPANKRSPIAIFSDAGIDDDERGDASRRRSVTLSRPFHVAGWQFDDLPCGFLIYIIVH